MKLSIKQEAVCEGIIEEFISGNNKYIGLDAMSGTGKSFIIKSLVDKLAEMTLNGRLLNASLDYFTTLTATTNVAASNLASDAITIHSYLGLTIKTDYKTGEITLVRSKGVRSNSFKSNNSRELLIIDEASMIDDQLIYYLDILDKNITILMVGDKDQFIAVKSIKDTSEAFNKCTKMFHLNEVYRSKDTQFNNYLVHLKNSVNDRVIKPIPIKVGGTLRCLSDEDYKMSLNVMFNSKPNQCSVIAFTNSMCSDYSKNIRSMLGKSEYPSNEYIQLKSPLIQKVGYKNINGFNLTKVDEPTDYMSLDILIEEKIEHKVYVTKGSDITLTNDVNGIKRALRLLAKRAKDKTNNSNWSAYFDLKNTVTQVNYGYARTGYASQGLSIPYVFLDITELTKLQHIIDLNTINRLIYVAISRASKRVFIRGKLPQQLLGKYPELKGE